MKATSKDGHEWTGETSKDGWFMYQDEAGNLYESKEAPAYRINMDNSCLVSINGKAAICPINPKSK